MTASPYTCAELIACLERLLACSDSLEWLRTLPPESSAYSAWRTCERGDWLAWLITDNVVVESVGDRTLRLIACDFVETRLPVWEVWAKEHALRDLAAPRRAVDVARAFADGKASADELSDADLAAARAARRADCHAEGDGDIADLAYSASDAAAPNAAYAARYTPEPTAEHARIVRRHVQWATVRDALLAAVAS